MLKNSLYYSTYEIDSLLDLISLNDCLFENSVIETNCKYFYIESGYKATMPIENLSELQDESISLQVVKEMPQLNNWIMNNVPLPHQSAKDYIKLRNL